MSEAELAIEEKLRRKRQEEQQAWQEYLQQRAKQRAKEEEDLRKLKERQARRKAQRAEDEKFMLELRRKQEAQRQQEFEEKRRKEAEAKRLRLEEAEKKRLAMQQAIKKRDEAARRNFIVKKTTQQTMAAPDTSGGPLVFGMKDVMKTKEQLAEDKKIAMDFRIKPLKIDGLAGNELKRVVNELWDAIVQLESDKYDLEEEQKRQEYHLKELLERQKQINKNKALKMGLDVEELNSNIPPKVRLASKYERKVDRRTFRDKTSLFNGGYVELTKTEIDKHWQEKVSQFENTHGDKHVPKWDPSAPRKDIVDKAKKADGESDSEDETDADLVDKLRGYVEEASRERRMSQQLEKELNEQRREDELARRRSSQMSRGSVTSLRSQHSGKSTTTPSKPQQQEKEEDEEEEEEDEEEEEEEEEEDEEEYEDEEEEEDE